MPIRVTDLKSQLDALLNTLDHALTEMHLDPSERVWGKD